MLDMGFAELLVVLAVALIVLGPKKLPELARSLGRGLAELRRTSEDLRRSLLLDDEFATRMRPPLRPPGSAHPTPARKDPDPVGDRNTAAKADPTSEAAPREGSAGEKGEGS